jgi:hypothetical protein
MLNVAMIKDRGNADFAPLVVLGNNKTSLDAIKESISDAYRQTLPGWIEDAVTISVQSIGDNTYILNSWATDENDVLTHQPVVCVVKVVSTPLYGKVD